jgi:hypothetical protein
MANSPAFSEACDRLNDATTFSEIEARGTVRLALKSSGLDAATVTVEQMAVVLDKVLPTELATRGIEGPDAVCLAIRDALNNAELAAPGGETPDTIFARLGTSGS